MSFVLKTPGGVTKYNPAKAFEGYTLFAPMSTPDAFLVDMRGRIVHHWRTPFPPAQHGRLLPNGNLLWPQKAKAPTIAVGGTGSEIIELDWSGKVVWRHEDPVINHDFKRLDNGNTIYNIYEEVPKNIADKLVGGVPNSEAEGKIFSSALREVDPQGKVVWEWKHYEHLDPTDGRHCPLCPRSIWGYTNGLDVLPNGDLLITLRFENDLAIIDKKTGKITWRWGQEYELGHPHCPTYLANGNVLVFDNGTHRRSKNRGAHELAHSRIVEVNPKTNKVEWEFREPNGFKFYSSICGGAQRLPNGNTLVCESTHGRFFEVTPDKEIVWEYVIPVEVPRGDYWGWTLSTCVFQCHRYAPNYPGLKGKDLSAEKYEWLLTEKGKEGQAKSSAPEITQKALNRLERLGY
jgi:outer membrane protein assembly factor BamB